MTKILLVEDDNDIADLVQLHLQRDGYQVNRHSHAESALAEIESEMKLNPIPFQLYILDWMLPGLSGLEIVKDLRLKKKSEAPILMLTARGAAGDVILGLESGADDYVQKPFDFPVLLARVRSLLRRAEKLQMGGISKLGNTTNSVGSTQSDPTDPNSKMTDSNTIPQSVECGGILIDTSRHEVRCKGEEIALTPSEFKLLWALATNQGRVLTRDRLIELVQGSGIAVIDRAIDTHIFGLRKKLGPCADVVETVRGIGYRIMDQRGP